MENELVELQAAARTLYDEAHHEIPDTTVLEAELFAFRDLLKRSKEFMSKERYDLLAEDAAQVEMALEEFLSQHANNLLLSSIEVLYNDIEQGTV